ncbi:CSF2R factor, partial [Crocuta crocuta]
SPGREGSGAVNFSCLIYHVRFMNCSWAPGPAAPADVQYRLFSWAASHEAEAECVHYVVDATGTRVGCHFDQLGKPHRTDNYFFLLNGTSRETQIPFLDFTPFKAVQMGKTLPHCAFSPPSRVSGLWAPPGARSISSTCIF